MMRADHGGYWVMLAMLVGVLAGCGGGSAPATSTQPELPPVAANPPPAPTPPTGSNSGGTHQAPQISGVPSTQVMAGDSYEFQPSVNDASGDAMSFSILNLPPWARFDSATGRLSGTPGAADVGTYSGITITVANAESRTTLPAFSVEVVQMGSGAATLSWVPPMHNTDGSTLRNLSGFFVHVGHSATRLDRQIRISNPTVNRYVVEGLSAGTWYFAVTAFNSNNVQSAMSQVLSKVIQ